MAGFAGLTLTPDSDGDLGDGTNDGV